MGHYPTMVKRILQSTALTAAFVGILALSSCDSAQRTVYLKDAEAQTYGVKYDSGLVIQKGDKLGITVSSLRNPELALPFNAKSLTAGGKTLSTLPTPSLPEGVNEPKSPDAQLSYLVDTNGNIQFPVLGSIQVQGMTLDQVSEIIRTRLVAEKYLVDAHPRAHLSGGWTVGAGRLRACECHPSCGQPVCLLSTEYALEGYL